MDAGFARPSVADLPVPAPLIEIARGHGGTNNVRLVFDKDLLNCGSAFSRNSHHASEWRPTFDTCDVTGELPSKAFISRARKTKRGVKPVALSNQSTVPDETTQKQPHGSFF